jgi:hypothetical protein
MKAVLAIPLLLAACGQAATPDNAANPAKVESLVPPDREAPVPAAFAYDENRDLIEFHYSWSAEMSAVPQLVAKYRAEMGKEKVALKKLAAADNNLTYAISKDITTKGQTHRLLSLLVEFYEFTGGAHGNHGSVGLLWDRQAAKEIKVADLFAAPANMDRLLTQPWCDALNSAREEKRGEPVGGGMFDECPKLSEISIIPTDKEGNGKFERLELIADPYVAGPYVEGSYEIALPVSGDLIAAIRSDYRGSFEVQPQ